MERQAFSLSARPWGGACAGVYLAWARFYLSKRDRLALFPVCARIGRRRGLLSKLLSDELVGEYFVEDMCSGARQSEVYPKSSLSGKGLGEERRRANIFSKLSRKERSASCIETGKPRSTRLVTPCSFIPQGTIPEKW